MWIDSANYFVIAMMMMKRFEFWYALPALCTHLTYVSKETVLDMTIIISGSRGGHDSVWLGSTPKLSTEPEPSECSVFDKNGDDQFSHWMQSELYGNALADASATNGPTLLSHEQNWCLLKPSWQNTGNEGWKSSYRSVAKTSEQKWNNLRYGVKVRLKIQFQGAYQELTNENQMQNL